MNARVELTRLKEKVVKATEQLVNEHKNNVLKNVDLDDKVDAFIKWHYENMVKEYYADIREYHKLRDMRNFIEKMAVWYELRYPDYEINRLMHCCEQEQININDVMFRNNFYVNDLLDEKSDIKELDWDEFYNTNVFIKSLPWEERYVFSKPRYKNIVYLKPKSGSAHLHLTNNGIVEMADYVYNWTNGVIKDEELEGLHVRKVVELFKERGIKLPESNELEETIKNVDNWIYQKEEMLNSVMYRIIERGGNRIGPRRAFLFAKEFKRNIDIPMMYGIDLSDSGLRLFINEYLKAGGSKDLECYVGYYSRIRKDEKLDTVSIYELMLENSYKYTPEEDALHQKLVNILATQIDQKELKQQEIKRLRLERKLEKSKK